MCAIAVVSGDATNNSGHLETLTLVAREDGSSRSHLAYTHLSPPFKPAAEQAIRKAQSKALPLLATDGSLSNKLLDLDHEWEETTEAAIRKELGLVADEISGLLPRIQSDDAASDAQRDEALLAQCYTNKKARSGRAFLLLLGSEYRLTSAARRAGPGSCRKLRRHRRRLPWSTPAPC